MPRIMRAHGLQTLCVKFTVEYSRRMGMPKREKRPTQLQTVTIRVSDETAQTFRDIARENNITQGEVLDYLLKEYLKTEKKRKK